MVDLIGAIALIVIGVILLIVANRLIIERYVNMALYIIGAIMFIVGLILLALYFVGYVV